MPHDELGILKAARDIISNHWCADRTHDGNGNHCATGAILVAKGMDPATSCVSMSSPEIVSVNDAARRLHPELRGLSAIHRRNYEKYGFDRYPAIFVNNELGQQAILEVFDDAIATLEVARLCAQVESQHPGLDAEKEAEGETVRSY